MAKRVKRQQVSRATERIALAEAQNWRCCYCGGHCMDWTHYAPEASAIYATIEHVVELCRGGSDEWDNLVMACYDCNCQRGNKMSAETFFEKKQLELMGVVLP